MDILLINPPFYNLAGETAEYAYPLSLVSLAAYLREHGISVSVLQGDVEQKLHERNWLTLEEDFEYIGKTNEYCESVLKDDNHVIWTEIMKIIKQHNPGVIGLYYLTPFKAAIDKLAGIIKRYNREIKIIVGGHHPTNLPEEVLSNGNIDYAIRGEGEKALLALMNTIKSRDNTFDEIPNLSYRGNAGNIINNPQTSLIANLDTLPMPARDLVINPNFDKFQTHFIITARGCPYNCSFCSDKSVWGGKVRYRNVDTVISEMKYIKEHYTLKYIDIVDGTFTHNRKYVIEFCEKLKKENLDIKWRGTARYNNLDNPGFLRLLKEAGCVALFLGIESGSQDSLDKIGKGISLEEIEEKNKWLQETGILIMNSVIIGLPDDTKEDIENTLEFLKNLTADIVYVNSFMPLPGSPLYTQMLPGQLENIDWSKIRARSIHNYFSKHIPETEFKKYLKEAYAIVHEINSRYQKRQKEKMSVS